MTVLLRFDIECLSLYFLFFFFLRNLLNFLGFIFVLIIIVFWARGLVILFLIFAISFFLAEFFRNFFSRTFGVCIIYTKLILATKEIFTHQLATFFYAVDYVDTLSSIEANRFENPKIFLLISEFVTDFTIKSLTFEVLVDHFLCISLFRSAVVGAFFQLKRTWVRLAIRVFLLKNTILVLLTSKPPSKMR